jgi:hypothetical protein
MSERIRPGKPKPKEPTLVGLDDFDEEGFAILCRKIRVLLIKGRRDVACRVLNQFAIRKYTHCVHLDDQVTEFLPVKIGEALRKNGFITFRAVKNAKDWQLLRIGNFGEKTLADLREVVRRVEQGELINLPDEPPRHLEQLCDRTKKEE